MFETNAHSADLVITPYAGELGELITSYDWKNTTLGDIASWPQSLKTCVHIMLSSRQPIWIGWGKDLIKLYNDPYKSIVGGKHPWALGKPASVVWEDIWHDIEPMLRQVMEEGIGTYVESQLLIMERNGYPEETYYTFSYTPVPGDDGKIAGMFCANTDDTDRIISERQLRTLTSLGKRLSDCKSSDEVINRTIATLQENPHDFPYAIFRSLSNNSLSFVHSTPLGDARDSIPLTYDLTDEDSIVAVKLKEAVNGRKILVFDQPEELSRVMPTGVWAKQSNKAIILPVYVSGNKDVFGTITVALNPYRLFDEKYQSFFELIADQINTSLADVNAFREEQKRAEALAEIDRAKTTFFSNISHELRTPLTLMLAPLEDALLDANTSPENKMRMDIAHRNTRRLLKLVNTLLDFSRIEAGRMNARFERVNLSDFTRDLSSTFRAAVEKAGMRLTVLMDQGIEGYVDIDMWEKIVLNLISNAFKYTHDGDIVVELKTENGRIILSVSDTGIGIPPEELDKVFERFHRVQNIGGRSQEGTGIGLALVQELVKLHGGTITVNSEVGKGSTFSVMLPLGHSHLSESQLVAENSTKFESKAEVYVEEVLKWLPNSHDEFNEDLASVLSIQPSANERKKYKLLIADDNSDMRAYLGRLLGNVYEVTSVNNGLDALEAISLSVPDLVLSDVMMPKLNGFELVQRLKENAKTKHIPVILLSARAGEEATIEGLAAGADDYMVKPFSAKELLSRIDSNLKIAESRINSIRQVNNLFMNAPIAIAILIGKELRFEIANEKYLELAGKTSVVGKTLTEAFPELENKGIDDLLKGVYETGTPFYGNEFEVDLVRQGKKEQLYMNFAYTPLLGIDNQITGVMVIAHDVTEIVAAKRKMEQVVAERTKELTAANLELKHSEERYHRMVEEVEDYAIILLDRNGIIQNWNKGAEKIKGYRENEIVGKSFQTFYLAEDLKNGLPDYLLNEAAAHGKVTREGWRVRKGGAQFWASIVITALHDELGNVIGFSKVTRDLTERKLAEDKLKKYSESLEIQNRELEQFAYAASHDMKEPLRKISFYGNSLKDRNGPLLDAKSSDYLDRILASTVKMTNLVDNLLNYSKTSANVESTEKMDLNAILSDIISGMYESLENDNISITVDKLPTIFGVQFQFSQLFDNLIHNAIKYRYPGRACIINIACEKVTGAEMESTSNLPFYKISVSDNGIGFEQQYAEKIFNIFQRLSTDKSGAGIGLAICKRIVLNHNGVIKAHGVPSEGARFDIYLPALSLGG